MVSHFGKGLKPSAPTKLGLGHPLHLFGAAPLPDSAEAPLPPAVDQGQTSSCTGNSAAVAICAAMSRVAGLPPGKWVELPSRLFLYFHARAEEASTEEDSGAALADIFDGAAKLGVPPESAWTFSEDLAKITANPDWNAYRLAADQRVVKGAWRLTSKGSQLVQDVAAAIAAGRWVVHGKEVNLAYENLVPGAVWNGVNGDGVGGHATVAWAYRRDQVHGFVFSDQSSWGRDFADHGSALISAKAMAQASEAWIVETVQPYSGEA